MTLEITPDRREEIYEILEKWTHQTSATKKDLQRLLGKLNFICNTVRAGRVFMTRIIEEMKKFPETGKRRLSGQLKMDVRWWFKFMSEFDGISVIPQVDWSRPDEIFSTDASLKMCGGWSEPEYFSAEFPQSLLKRKDISINELELTAFIIAIKVWKHKTKDRDIWRFVTTNVLST